MQAIHAHGQQWSLDAIQQSGATLLGSDADVHAFSFNLMQSWLRGDAMFTFQTSGSTGVPKTILLQRSQLEASALAAIQASGLNAADHVYVAMSTRFIGGAMLVIRALIAGCSITFDEPQSQPLLHMPENHPYTVASFAPLQLLDLEHNAGTAAYNRFRLVWVGGAGISPQLEQAIGACQPMSLHTYGMTETVSHVALRRIGTATSFTLLPGVEASTNDESCIRLKGAMTLHEWVQTHDVVTFTESGQFVLLGRSDEVINSGGIKLWPAKIESALRSVWGTSANNLFVAGIADERLGEKLVVVVASETPEIILAVDLKAALAEKLERYEVPKSVYVLPSFPLTGSGKTDKREALKMLGL